MTALVSAVLVASLLGSTHCAGMCGAFLAFAVAGPEASGSGGPASTRSLVANRARLHAAYNGGRLLTYLILGALAGLLGAALDLGGAAVGLQRVAAALAGAMMIVFGGAALLRASGVRLQKLPVPGALQRFAIRGHRAAASLPPILRAAAVGLLTTLLPCGWLYAFVITAAGTGAPERGALVMGVFWLGTLPVMIGLGVGLQTLTGALRRHLPLATSLLIVAVGMWTLAGRLRLPPMWPSGNVPEGTEASVDAASQLDPSEAPCCHAD